MFHSFAPLLQVAELSLTYQYKVPTEQRKKITSSSDVADFIRPYYSDCIELKEHAYALLLNHASHVIGIYKLSEGGISGTVVDLRILFCVALKALAMKIVLVHNHPSGNLRPSQSDLTLTRRAKEAARLLEIDLLDHIIISQDGYYSLADNGDIA